MKWTQRCSILLLAGIAVAAFAVSVHLRDEWRTTLSMEHHQWLTGSTLVHAGNWFREGPQNVGFAHVLNPRSIEFSSLSDRGIYPSYPVGCIVPIYVISRILNTEPSDALVMNYNLLNHFLVGVCLTLIVFIILRRTGHGHFVANVLSLVPIGAAYFTPSLMYWFQNVYWADQAVVLPVVLLILLEIVRNDANARIVGPLYALAVFHACFTDYLGFVAAGVLLIYHLVLAEHGGRRTLYELVLPAVLALLLFLGHVHYLGAWDRLVSTFFFRTALSADGQAYVTDFFTQFYLGWITRDFGFTGLLVLVSGFLASLIYLLSRLLRPASRGAAGGTGFALVMSTIFILATPPVAQTWLLENHSVIHDFSALKFGPPYAALFVLLPLAGLAFFGRSFMDFQVTLGSRKLPYLALILAGVFVWHQAGLLARLPDYFPAPDPDIEAQGRFLDRVTEYRDVVFSFSTEIPALPPQPLAYSMKRVYRVESFQQALERLREWNVDEGARVSFFFRKRRESEMVSRLRATEDLVRHETGDYFLIQAEPDRFVKLVREEPDPGGG